MEYSQLLKLLPGGLLKQSLIRREAIVVLMGEVRVVDFRQTPVIGTFGLGGCNVALIVSDLGAILAHIPPTTSRHALPGEGDANLRRMMEEVQREYNNHRALFPAAGTYVVCAWVEGVGVLMQDHVDIIINDYFRMMGLAATTFHYPAPRAAEPYDGQGTVVVLSGDIYVEDKLVANAPGLSQGPTTTAGPSGTQGHLGYTTPGHTTAGYTTPGHTAPGYTTAGYTAPGYGTAQAPTPALYQSWTQGNASFSTAQGSTTTLGSNVMAYSTTTPGTAQQSTTTMDSSWAQSMYEAQGPATTSPDNWAQSMYEAQGPATASADSWVKVNVQVHKRPLMRTHFTFHGQNRKVTTVRDNWQKMSLQGETVWACRGARGTTYYTDLDIGNA